MLHIRLGSTSTLAFLRVAALVTLATTGVVSACDDQVCTLSDGINGCYIPTVSCDTYTWSLKYVFDHSSLPNPATDFDMVIKIASDSSDNFQVTFSNPVCQCDQSDDRNCISTCSTGGTACNLNLSGARLENVNPVGTETTLDIVVTCHNTFESCSMTAYVDINMVSSTGVQVTGIRSHATNATGSGNTKPQPAPSRPVM